MSLHATFPTMEEMQDFLKRNIATFQDFPVKGVNFKDIQSILKNPELSQAIMELSMDSIENQESLPDAILGFDARGFLFGFSLAGELHVPFFLARKTGKLPGELITVSFEKEYGTDTLSIQKGLIKPGMKVLVHDDLLATGGTARAAVELIEKEGGIVSGFHFIMELEYLSGRKKLKGLGEIISMVKYAHADE